MSKNWIIGFIVILGLIGFGIWLKPKNSGLNWFPSYNAKDKIPLGTYIFNSSLLDLFPKSILKTNSLPIYSLFEDNKKINKLSNSVLFLINQSIGSDYTPLTKTDFSEILKYVRKGNSFFWSSGELDGPIGDEYKISLLFNYSSTLSKNKIHLKDSTIWSKESYTIPERNELLNGIFKIKENKRIRVLGTNSDNQPNFIEIQEGKGRIFLHACPAVFSNYFLIYKNNTSYLSSALSYIPPGTRSIIWDEYYQISHIPLNPLEYLLSQPNIKAGVFCTLLAFLLYATFQIKRRQRVIPILPQPVNRTLEFIETMGLLYFEKKDNRNLADKMISQFSEYLRLRFYILPKNFSNENLPLIVSKTNKQPEEIKALMAHIKEVQQIQQISDQELLILNQQIQQFYT